MLPSRGSIGIFLILTYLPILLEIIFKRESVSAFAFWEDARNLTIFMVAFRTIFSWEVVNGHNLLIAMGYIPFLWYFFYSRKFSRIIFPLFTGFFTLVPPHSIGAHKLIPELYIYQISVALALTSILVQIITDKKRLYVSNNIRYFIYFLGYHIFLFFLTQNPENSLHHLIKLFLFFLLSFVSAIYLKKRLYLPVFILGATLNLIVLIGFAIFIQLNSDFVLNTNTNLFAMYAEWIVLILMINYHSGEKKYKLITLFIQIAIISILIYIDAKGSIASIAIALILVWSGIFISKSNPISHRFLKYSFIITGILIILGFFVYYYPLTDSLKIRTELWKLSMNGILENPKFFLFGRFDYGPYLLIKHSDNFFNFAYLEQLFSNLGNHWYIDTHPHSEAISILYGSGILGFLGHYAIQFYAIFLCLKKNDYLSKVYLSLVTVYLIHGIIEPISTTYFTGILFYVILFRILSEDKDSKIRFFRINLKASLILILLIFNLSLFLRSYYSKEIFKSIFIEKSKYLSDSNHIENREKNYKSLILLSQKILFLNPLTSDLYQLYGKNILLGEDLEICRNECKNDSLRNLCFSFYLSPSASRVFDLKEKINETNLTCDQFPFFRNTSLSGYQKIYEIIKRNTEKEKSEFKP